MMLTDKFLVDEKTQEKRFSVCKPCHYYNKDKNKCISEHIKNQINNLMIHISSAEYEIKNLDKYINKQQLGNCQLNRIFL